VDLLGANVAPAKPLTIKAKTNVVGQVTIVPNGTDSVENSSVPMPLNPQGVPINFPSVTLYPDSVAGNWIVLASH